MKAMILAAGLGTRLLPYSLLRPKPLFPVLDRPLLLQTIDRLKEAGFTTIIVNCHHLAEQFQPILADIKGLHLQREEMILGTGGGLRRAVDLMGDEPLLVVNGDIYHTIDYGEVYRQHCQQKSKVSLVLHDYPRFNNVCVDAALSVTGFTKTAKNPAALAFTGIHIVNPEVLRLIPAGTFSNIIDCYQLWMNRGNTIRACVVTGHFWTDIGTPTDYLKLHGDLLRGRVKGCGDPAPGRYDGRYTADSAIVGHGVTITDWAAIGSRSRIGNGAKLSRVVVWDGAVVKPGAELAGLIVT